MCFGGGGSSQTVIQQDKLPTWVQEAAQSNIASANNLSSRGYTTYGGPRVAAFTPNQSRSFDLARDIPGSGAASFQTAKDTTSGIATGAGFGQTLSPTKWTEADIGAYMNPFMSNVLNPQLDIINRQAAIDRNKIGAAANAAGAYGDARHGVREAALARDTAQLRSNTAGQALYQAFGDAGQRFAADEAAKANAFNINAGQFNAERNARMQAANQLGALTQQQIDQAQRDAFFLNQMGAMEQEQVQKNYDTAYQDFRNQQEFPVEMLNLRMAALSGTPYATSRMSQQPGPNTTAQNLGAAGATLGGLGTFFNRNNTLLQ